MIKLQKKMKKMEIVDVYQLYLGQKDILKGQNILRNKKIGLAYVPTKDCSQFCRSLFSNNEGYVLVECKYIAEKDKWMPYKKPADSRYPDTVDKVYINSD